MILSFESHYEDVKDLFQESLASYLNEMDWPRSERLAQLQDSVRYSLMGSGKRFRPVLSIFIADSFGAGPQKVLPWAAAIEMIHTYSLIHDDLPSMDNDDLRRGVPTNHKVYGESTALLAGDALLTEAFLFLAKNYSGTPDKAVSLIQILGEAAGLAGMISGQAIDLSAKSELSTEAELIQMHDLKTGALIRASAEGAAVVLGLTPELRQNCRNFGATLGLCFQLKDDLLDSQNEIEVGSFPACIGLEATQKLLEDKTKFAQAELEKMDIDSGPLWDLIDMNLKRTK